MSPRQPIAERPHAHVTFVVTVGVDRDSLTADEARLLLHDACDALAAKGGPLVRIWADTDAER